ncbi:ubiquitin thioesterase otulin-like [Myxocyprinus asiaticus]|uniref:ubiquitin thioesterase otulin-like n=1 Tax=Myxocyprinus asiaticus TaxID=70543 RepID=UPI0022223D54|nr:ubiquitin thioesterase otulin-like [Myxocyprinus asiaticus]
MKDVQNRQIGQVKTMDKNVNSRDSERQSQHKKAQKNHGHSSQQHLTRTSTDEDENGEMDLYRGEEEIEQDLQEKNQSKVRGDNYCALRVTLFQVLSQSNQHPVWSRDPDFIKWPKQIHSDEDLIQEWRFPFESRKSKVELLEQSLELLKKRVEMCLLGHSLQQTIQVYRLYKSDTEEFITYYPSHHREDWPCLCLLTEDDRHYNALVPKFYEYGRPKWNQPSGGQSYITTHL